MSGALSFAGLIIGVILLIVLAFRGVPIMLTAPLCAIIIALFSGIGIYEILSTSYMTGFANFFLNYFLMLSASAIFGKIMGESGATDDIAFYIAKLSDRFPQKYQKTVCVVSICLIYAILTYGGVSLFVVTFAVTGIAVTLFREKDIPWHLAFCIGFGTATFAMTMLPGSPQLVNLVPVDYLGTTPTAAPGIGILSALLCIVLGLIYIRIVVRRSEKRGEGFMKTGAQVLEIYPNAEIKTDVRFLALIKALIPCVVLLVGMNLCGLPPVMALLLASLMCIVLYFPVFRKAKFKPMLVTAMNNSISATVTTASMFGFGACVSAVAGFDYLINLLDKVPGPPIVQMIIAIECAAGICGSSSGGLGIALGSLSDRFLNMGIDPAAIHRIGAIAAGGLDSLPHAGATYVGLSNMRLELKQCYYHQAWLCIVIPIICAIFAAVLYSVFGVF